jgi:hypothetical protein
MNQKLEITKYVASQLGLDTDEKSIKKYRRIWWYSTRSKDKGGLQLTEIGFDCLKQAGLQSYKIRFHDPMQYTNQEVIWLDNFIDCPWFLSNLNIQVFSESMAIQLVLFSGDIKKYVGARAKSLKSVDRD